jgi:hypothetical protein
MYLTNVLCKISVVQYSSRSLIGKSHNKHILGVIILIYKKLCVVMQPKFWKNSNNSFKKLILMHLTYVLCKISVIEYLYQSFN